MFPEEEAHWDQAQKNWFYNILHILCVFRHVFNILDNLVPRNRDAIQKVYGLRALHICLQMLVFNLGFA